MIVRVTPELCPAVGRVWAESWRQAHAGAVDPAYAAKQTTALYAGQVLAPNMEAYAAQEQGEVCGVLRLDLCTGELATLYVVPAWQGKGLGGALLRFGVARLRQCGFVPWLGVLSNNRRAAAVYEHCGFVPTGEELVLDAARGIREIRYRWNGALPRR